MNLEWKQLRRIGVCIFVLYLAIYYYKTVAGVATTIIGALWPLFLGLAIAYMVNILMDMYEDYFFPNSSKPIVDKLRRPLCLFGAVITLIAIIGILVYLILPELIYSLKVLIKSLPNAVNELTQNKYVKKVVPDDAIKKLTDMDWKAYINETLKFFKTGITGMAENIATVAGSVFSTFISVILGIIFALYLLAGKERFQLQGHRLIRVFIKKKYQEKLLHYMSVCNDCFHNYIVGKLVDAVIMGVLTGLGMALFRLPYAMMVGVLVGFTALIPVAGAYVGAIVGAIIILTESPMKAAIFLVFIIVLQQIEGNLIYPKIMGDSVGLPGIWVLAAVAVGGSLAGIIGMLIGVPIVATIYKVVKEEVLELEEKKGIEPMTKLDNPHQERWQKLKKIAKISNSSKSKKEENEVIEKVTEKEEN